MWLVAQTLLLEQGTCALVVQLLCSLMERYDPAMKRAKWIATLCVGLLRVAVRKYHTAQRMLAQYEIELTDHLALAHTETVLTELYINNVNLLRMANPELPRTFVQSVQAYGKTPEYLVFLKTLCLCDGVPITHTQNMIADIILNRGSANVDMDADDSASHVSNASNHSDGSDASGYVEREPCGLVVDVFLEVRISSASRSVEGGAKVSVRDPLFEEPGDEGDGWHSIDTPSAAHMLRYLVCTYELLAALCTGRNRSVCDTLLARDVCERLVIGLTSLRAMVCSTGIPIALRTAAVSLLRALYIDREPQEARDMIASTRTWVAVDPAAVRGTAAARAAARGVAGQLPKLAVEEAQRQASELRSMYSRRDSHGSQIKYTIVNPFAEFPHIPAIKLDSILDDLIETLRSLHPQISSGKSDKKGLKTSTQQPSGGSSPSSSRLNVQPPVQSTGLTAGWAEPSDTSCFLASVLQLSETIIMFGGARLEQLRDLFVPTLGLIGKFNPDTDNELLFNNAAKHAKRSYIVQRSFDHAAFSHEMLLAALSVLTVLLDAQLDERLARFQEAYETQGCPQLVRSLQRASSLSSLGQLPTDDDDEDDSHTMPVTMPVSRRSSGVYDGSDWLGFSPLLPKDAEKLAAALFEKPIIAAGLGAIRTSSRKLGAYIPENDERLEKASSAQKKNRAKDSKTLLYDAHAIAGTTSILLRLTKCDEARVRTKALHLVLRHLSQREAFVSRLQRVSFITNPSDAKSLREFGYATFELRRYCKWVAGDELSRRADAINHSLAIVRSLTDELRGRPGQSPNELRSTQEMVRFSGSLSHVITLLQIPLVLKKDTATSSSSGKHDGDGDADAADKAALHHVTHVTPLPEAVDSAHLKLTQASLRFIEAYCDSGEKFQRDVRPHAPLLMARMAVHHLDASGAVASLMRDNEEILMALVIRCVTAVLRLTMRHGRRARWIALLRATLVARGNPIPKNQQAMLDILVENRALLLDLEGRHNISGSLQRSSSGTADGVQASAASSRHLDQVPRFDARRTSVEAERGEARVRQNRQIAHRGRLELICAREQLHAYKSTLGYHIHSLHLLAGCAAGRNTQRQVSLQSLITFEQAVKEYIDCGLGAEYFDEVTHARNRAAAAPNAVPTSTTPEATAVPTSPVSTSPVLQNPNKGKLATQLAKRHILSILSVKAGWLGLLTTAYLECYTFHENGVTAGLNAAFSDHGSGHNTNSAGTSSLSAAMRSHIWPDDYARDLQPFAGKKTDGQDDLGYPSMSLLESLAVDVEAACEWRTSLDCVEAAEDELNTMSPAPPPLTPAAGEREIPKDWVSGEAVVNFIAKGVVGAVRAIFESPMLNEGSSGAPRQLARSASAAGRLGRALVEFANSPGAPPMSIPQLLELNDLIERYLDVRSDLPRIKIGAKRTNAAAIESSPSPGGASATSAQLIKTERIAGIARHGFSEWAQQIAIAAGVRDSKRRLGVGTAAAASLLLSPSGQEHMPCITTSLRLLAAHLRNCELERRSDALERSSNLSELVIANEHDSSEINPRTVGAQHEALDDAPLPTDLVTRGANLGLRADRVSLAAAAEQAQRDGLFLMALRVLRAMVYIRSLTFESAPGQGPVDAIQAMADGEPPSGGALQTAIRYSLGPKWGLHRVALSFVGLQVQGEAALRLLQTLLLGAQRCSEHKLRQVQAAVVSHASTDEGKTLGAQLQLQLGTIASWTPKHRETRRMVNAYCAIDDDERGGDSRALLEGMLTKGSAPVLHDDDHGWLLSNPFTDAAQALRRTPIVRVSTTVAANAAAVAYQESAKLAVATAGVAKNAAAATTAAAKNAAAATAAAAVAAAPTAAAATVAAANAAAGAAPKSMTRLLSKLASMGEDERRFDVGFDDIGTDQDILQVIKTDNDAAQSACELLEFLQLLCFGGNKGIQDLFRRNMNYASDSSSSEGAQTTKAQTLDGQDNGVGSAKSILASAIAVLEPLLRALDLADTNETDIAFGMLELVHLLIQANPRARDIAATAGLLRVVNMIMTVVGHYIERSPLPMETPPAGPTGQKALFIGRVRDVSSSLKPSSIFESFRHSDDPNADSGTAEATRIKTRACMLRASALRTLLATLQTRGGEKHVAAVMRAVPAPVLLDVMTNAVNSAGATEATTRNFSEEGTEELDEGFVAHFVLDKLLVFGKHRESRAAVAAAAVTIGEQEDDSRQLGISSDQKDDAAVAHYLARVRTALEEIPVWNEVDRIFLAETGRVEVVIAHTDTNGSAPSARSTSGVPAVGGDRVLGNDEVAVSEVMLFRKHPLALMLGADERWRARTLARLRMVPRGDGVPIATKRFALFTAIDELALEEIAAAARFFYPRAKALLRVLLPVLACVLNFLTISCVKLVPSASDPTQNTFDRSDCAFWGKWHKTMAATYLALMSARIVLSLSTRWPILETLWREFNWRSNAKAENDDGDIIEEEEEVVSRSRQNEQMLRGGVANTTVPRSRASQNSQNVSRRRKSSRVSITDESHSESNESSVADMASQFVSDLEFYISESHGDGKLQALLLSTTTSVRAALKFAPALAGTFGFEAIFFTCATLGLAQVWNATPLWYSVLLLDIARDRYISFLLRSVRGSLRLLLGLMTLVSILLVILVTFALASDPDRLECDSAWQCVVRGLALMLVGVPPLLQRSNVDYRSGLPFDPVLLRPDEDYGDDEEQGWGGVEPPGGGFGNDVAWVLLNVFGFVLLVLLLHTLVTGIIFNQFAAQTDAADALARDEREVCLVCSLRRSAFVEQSLNAGASGSGSVFASIAWRTHTQIDHNPLEYVALAITLRMRQKQINGVHNMTSHEQHVLDRLLKHDASVLPLEQCVALLSAKEDSAAGTVAPEAFLSSRIDKLEAEIRAQRADMRKVGALLHDLSSQMHKENGTTRSSNARLSFVETPAMLR